MLKKWTLQLGEENFVRNSFEPAWGQAAFTRAELNQFGHAGLPPDNNALEGKNGGQKEYRDHAKETVVYHCSSHKDWMAMESTADLSFGLQLNRAAWNTKLFQDVWVLSDRKLCDVMSIVYCFKAYRPGAVIIPSNNTISSLITKSKVANELNALKYALTHAQGGADSWLKTFKDLILKPAETVSASAAALVRHNFQRALRLRLLALVMPPNHL